MQTGTLKRPSGTLDYELVFQQTASGSVWLVATAYQRDSGWLDFGEIS